MQLKTVGNRTPVDSVSPIERTALNSQNHLSIGSTLCLISVYVCVCMCVWVDEGACVYADIN